MTMIFFSLWLLNFKIIIHYIISIPKKWLKYTNGINKIFYKYLGLEYIQYFIEEYIKLIIRNSLRKIISIILIIMTNEIIFIKILFIIINIKMKKNHLKRIII